VNGPRLQHSADFQAKVVVQATRFVSLYDEPVPSRNGRSRFWLRCAGEVALAGVVVQGPAFTLLQKPEIDLEIVAAVADQL
jgi:hypothetical protein